MSVSMPIGIIICDTIGLRSTAVINPISQNKNNLHCHNLYSDVREIIMSVYDCRTSNSVGKANSSQIHKTNLADQMIPLRKPQMYQYTFYRFPQQLLRLSLRIVFYFIFCTFSFILQSFENEDCQLDLNVVSERT